MAWTREALESLKGWERPSVRVRVDGEGAYSERSGRLAPDANKCWVEIWTGEVGWYAVDFSWGAVLEALNDRFAPPLPMPDVPPRNRYFAPEGA